jgi:FKBP-type peptidyl-prolyl cis-trans isomerase SlyD
MTIKQDAVVAIEYTLRNDAGDVIDSSDGEAPLYYLHGHENIVPGLEAALDGKLVGDVIDVVIEPAEGYGDRDPERVLELPRGQLPEDLEPEEGMMLAMETPAGDHVPLTVTKVEADTVTVDANHTLAGETLHFHVEVVEIRAATSEELAHGHVHGPHAHH